MGGKEDLPLVGCQVPYHRVPCKVGLQQGVGLDMWIAILGIVNREPLVTE
jgi:hypothetical protein